MSDEAKKEVQNPPAPIAKPAPIALNDKGVALPQSLEEQFRMASIWKTAGMAPRGFDTPEKIMVGWHYAAELGFGPSFLRCMYIVNNIPTLHSDGPLTVVRKSRQLKRIEELQFDPKGLPICLANNNMDAECVSAVCRVTHVNGEITERSFTLTEAKTANLLGKDTYKLWRRRMFQMRARAWALKDGFTDVLQGVSIAEYNHNLVTTDAGEVLDEIRAPAQLAANTGADEINLAFGAKEETPEAEHAPVAVS